MRIIGLDLAWSPRNTSGGCVLDWDGRHASVFHHVDGLGGDGELRDFLHHFVPPQGSCLVAVDAPLIVPNELGSRPAENLLNAVYRKHHAGAHPANRKRLCAWGGGRLRAEVVLATLRRRGFSADPFWQPGHQRLRRIVEVFPHAASVALFGLDRIFRYKARPGRSREFILAELDRCRSALLSLERRDPPALFPREILTAPLDRLRGRALKRHEDLVDSFLCAYAALHCWKHGGEVFGDLKSGHILVPRRDLAPQASERF